MAGHFFQITTHKAMQTNTEIKGWAVMVDERVDMKMGPTPVLKQRDTLQDLEDAYPRSTWLSDPYEVTQDQPC